jgi:release factor glutamine methyltransferase
MTPDMSSAPALARRTCRFGPLSIEYDERVLRPRPWTIAQSEWAMELAAEAPPGPLLELCAGAGHIGLVAAAATGRPIVQVEADPVAAEFARRNAQRARVEAEVRVRRLEEATAPDERFPLVIADPPYLPSSDIVRWPDDPVSAIDGGPDGLAVVRACLTVAARCLESGGPFLLQVAGPGQAEAVARLADPDFRAEDVRVTDPERAVQLLVRR